MKKDIFLGVGGSASSNIFGKYFFNRPSWGVENLVESDNFIVILMSGVDSGGSIGMQNDLYEIKNGLVNGYLHGRTDFPFQSYGDLKHFIIQSLNFKKPEVIWKNFLDFRSNNLGSHQQKFFEFSHLTNLPITINHGFVRYLKLFFEYFQENKQHLKPERIKPVCLGNVLLSFLHYTAGHINNLTSLMQEFGLIPNWVDFVFLSENRTYLRGMDFFGNQVNGEHLFDEWEQPILPQSHEIVDYEKTSLTINPRVLEYLSDLHYQDKIIIPPGSDSNWIGIVNNAQIFNLIKNHTILWLANLFRFTSETPLPQTINYLCSLGLKLQIFLPEINFAQQLFKFENLRSLESYVLKEHKVPQLLYFEKYKDLVNQGLAKIANKQSKTDLVSILEKEMSSSKTLLPNHWGSNLHYLVKIKSVGISYCHDSDFAVSWLKNPCLTQDRLNIA